jgi:hypothetical protein
MLDVSLILIKLYKILFKKEAVSGALLRLTGMIVVPVIFGVIFYLLVNMDSCSILKDISETVYSRFSMGLEAIKRYSINLFGNKITFVTSSQRYFSNSSDSYFVVDCLYILLLVRFGIIATLYYVYQLYLVIIKSIRKKDTYLFMGMILLLLYSVLENGMTVIGTSYMFVAASARWSEENRYE